ncbi:hypothetical protein CI109_104315 [Kwoniella shandongensis]|uniref:Histone-lysine N-methyltransferase, H3 lysine-36 specific n=1 Tax=Kwoniella shandongensis TaxID=1734106 RepID=A0A5M6BYJ8_9TREE|nr:uncharacterized protein CI109_004289 [Kwoniella shandongensis]KAA5527471.1 hypothetical protein CI109_004289 [Kwoniella shandongensis]
MDDIENKPKLEDLWADEPVASSSTSGPTAQATTQAEDQDIKKPMTTSRSRSVSPPSTPIGLEDLKSRITSSAGPTLIDDLPTAWDEAHETFETLEKCVYERKDMGLSKENDEMMVCDCVWDRDDPDCDPCGVESDCINRALFIECLAGECRAGKHCRNQQFAKRQYANVEVVLTEKKGYGLRAGSSIPSNTLIYEYIGEVVMEKTFRKRMQLYADEGIRHFYFMMLQKEEYIDATKKGGIGRFANHSCNPNSEVQKWVVGRRLRMGIFTKRDVVKGEEITFNYNVDRYGHDAQICYCGEPNCVGTIGGKTQTDIGTMNDLFLDALGITDEVEAMGMKGSKKKKSRQLDEDFVPTLRPIEEPEVQKVAAAMRQSMENKTMMSRLLQRVKMTEEISIQRQLMRMHGFSLMNMILSELADDRETILLALESMKKWKLQNRNKVEDSNVEEPVKALCETSDEEISRLAKGLIDYWGGLELSYKIPRVHKISNLDADDEAGTTTIAEEDSRSAASRRPDAWENTNQIQIEIAPVRPRPPPMFSRPRPPLPFHTPKPTLTHSASSSDRLKLDAIIAMAQQTVQAAVAIPPPSESPAAESSRSGSRMEDEDDRRKRQKRSHDPFSIEEENEKKEKRLTKLVGDVVVRAMSKYKEQMEHDTFKRYARECTAILVEKEKKGHSYSTTRHPSLSDEKKVKMKAFTKEFTHKVLKRLKEKGKLRKPSGHGHTNGGGGGSSATPSASASTLTPTPTPGGSTMVDTPQREKDGSLVDDIFGADDEDDADMELDQDQDEPPTPSRHPATSPESKSSRSVVQDVNSTPTPMTVRKMNGGFTVERLSLAGLGKVNGLTGQNGVAADERDRTTSSTAGTPSSTTVYSVNEGHVERSPGVGENGH